MGPYEGTVVYKDDLDDIEDTSYMWEVSRYKISLHIYRQFCASDHLDTELVLIV